MFKNMKFLFLLLSMILTKKHRKLKIKKNEVKVVKDSGRKLDDNAENTTITCN